MEVREGQYGKIEDGPDPDTVTKRMPLFKKRVLVDSNLNEAIVARWLGMHGGVPHLVEYRNVRIDRATGDLLVEQRLARHGTLHTFIRNTKLPARMRVVRRVFDALLEGMHHLHLHGVVHGDLKASNVVLDDVADDTFDVRIIDLGSCQLFRRCPPRHNKLCTYVYAPPEMFEDGAPDLPKTDAYSLGALLFEFAFRDYYVTADVDWNSYKDMRKMHRAGALRCLHDCPLGFPPDIFLAMQQLLQPEPSKRAGISELYHRMHPSSGKGAAQPTLITIDPPSVKHWGKAGVRSAAVLTAFRACEWPQSFAMACHLLDRYVAEVRRPPTSAEQRACTTIAMSLVNNDATVHEELETRMALMAVLEALQFDVYCDTYDVLLSRHHATLDNFALACAVTKGAGSTRRTAEVYDRIILSTSAKRRRCD